MFQFLVPLGVHTCACWVFKDVLALLKAFLANCQKSEFLTFLPPLNASKLHFGGCRQSFLGASGDPNMHKTGQKGLPRCRKAQSNVQNTLEVLRNPFPNFRKIVEFGTFRQDRLGQLSIISKISIQAESMKCSLSLF